MDWSFGNIAPDSHPPEEAIAPGVVIGGRYQVVDVLGSGAQGEVLAANDLQLGRTVAVKLLKSHQDTPRERFLREGRLTASLTHPNVVSLLAGGVTPDGRPFLVLELLDDPVPLDVYVRDEPLDVRMRLFADVCRGVGAAHSAGVVHRDLKPSNLLVDRHGHVRVCDFGLSVHQHEEAALTQTNTVVGTPLYMSPEALLGTERNRSPQQDVWSLGVLLYQLLTD
ncbi:MAG: serine/threonine protein kinase, partial [Planctomycetes bacterium]|nr:serine/threonine protein kinase [Planctomycetota bacterium]